MRPASTPMRSTIWQSPGGSPASRVLVLLPGMGDRDTSFDRRGIIEVLQRVTPDTELIAADAHFGYYRTRSMLPRLHEDVIIPAVEKSDRPLWLMGVSMGGLGSVLYARTHPESVAGVILLSPYLGPQDLAEEIEASGGLCSWAAGPAPVEDPRKAHHLNWQWLQSEICTGEMRVWIGWGDEEDPGPGGGLLAAALPKDHQCIRPGGHGWDVWRPLVEDLVRSAWAAP